MFRRLFPEGFPAAEPPPSGSGLAHRLLALGLFAALVALYWPAVDFRFLAFDDRYYTHGNLIAGGLDRDAVLRMFTTLPDEDLFIPLTQLSFMLDVEIFGLAARGFHLTNLLLHAASMTVLFLVLRGATGSTWKSFFAASLVAFHPMRVESVAWITERKDVLAALFLFLSLGCHVRFARTGRYGWAAALFSCALLGMLAKPVAVTLPVLLLILDFWPLGRFRRTDGEAAGGFASRRAALLVAEKIPLFALSALFSWITLRLQGPLAVRPEPLLSRVEHALAAPFLYLWHTIWPVDLVFRYFQPSWDRFSGTLLPAAAAFALACALVVRFSRNRPWLLAGWAWFLLVLFPSSGIVPAGLFWISDRFTYVAHVGLAVAAAWSVSTALPGRFRKPAAAGAAALLLLLAGVTRHELSFWRDGAALFGRGVAQGEKDPRYVAQYAEELIELGRLDQAEAVLDNMAGVATDPWFGTLVQNHRMALLEKRGDRAGAVEAARSFLSRDPGFWKTRNRMAENLRALGRYAEASVEYERLLEVPQATPFERRLILEGLGASYAGLGKDDDALACFGEAARDNPDPASIYARVAPILARKGRTSEALALFADAIRRTPWDPAPRLGAGDLLLASGDVTAAAAQFQAAARLGGGMAEGFYAEGRLREAAGRRGEAIAFYGKALEAPAAAPETMQAARERLGRLR